MSSEPLMQLQTRHYKALQDLTIQDGDHLRVVNAGEWYSAYDTVAEHQIFEARFKGKVDLKHIIYPPSGAQ